MPTLHYAPSGALKYPALSCRVSQARVTLTRRRALKRKLAGIWGKLTVVKRQIAEIQAQEKWTTENPGLFGQQSPSHPGLCALQDPKRLERAVEHLERELRGE